MPCNCGRPRGKLPEIEVLRPKVTPEQLGHIGNFLTDVDDMLTGKARHEGHTREQHGRCIFCSCGMRVQGRL